MALLAGEPLDEVRRSVQHGHPQLTIADLLGSPLPQRPDRAPRSARDIRVAWRDWISLPRQDHRRVQPHPDQDAVGPAVADGRGLRRDVRAGRPLRAVGLVPDGQRRPRRRHLPRHRGPQGPDRPGRPLHAVPRAAPRRAGRADRLGALARGVRARPTWSSRPEELDEADRRGPRRRRSRRRSATLLGFLLGQLDFCRRASDRLEYQNKDTLHLAGRRVGHVCTEDCPLDKQREPLHPDRERRLAAGLPGAAPLRQGPGLLPRPRRPSALDDLRPVLPWVLHDKLRLNPQSAFFQKPENQVYLTDRVSWIRQLFDQAVAAARRLRAGPPGRRWSCEQARPRTPGGSAGVEVAGAAGAGPRADRGAAPQERAERRRSTPTWSCSRTCTTATRTELDTRPSGVGEATMTDGRSTASVERRGRARARGGFVGWDAARVRPPTAPGPARRRSGTGWPAGRTPSATLAGLRGACSSEAVGAGYLAGGDGPATAARRPNFLDFCLLRAGARGPGRRAARRAGSAAAGRRVWNLGEGLLARARLARPLRHAPASAELARRRPTSRPSWSRSLGPCWRRRPAAWAGPFARDGPRRPAGPTTSSCPARCTWRPRRSLRRRPPRPGSSSASCSGTRARSDVLGAFGAGRPLTPRSRPPPAVAVATAGTARIGEHGSTLPFLGAAVPRGRRPGRVRRRQRRRLADALDRGEPPDDRRQRPPTLDDLHGGAPTRWPRAQAALVALPAARARRSTTPTSRASPRSTWAPGRSTLNAELILEQGPARLVEAILPTRSATTSATPAAGRRRPAAADRAVAVPSRATRSSTCSPTC